MEFLESDTPENVELVDLYDSVGWSAYTEDSRSLGMSITNSTYLVTARNRGDLIGLARGMSDDVSVFYLQDLVVRPEFQGEGVGRRLLEMSLEKHSHVRQTVLMTDDDQRIHDLYQSLGFSAFPTEDGLNGFVRISSRR